MTYSFQWERCDPDGSNCVDIGGATGSIYTVASADVGKAIRVRVSDGIATAVSAPTAVVTTPIVATRFFADTAFCNLVVPTSPAIDANNAAYQSHIRTSTLIWTNGTPGMGGAWSATVYHATGSEPTKTVALAIPSPQPFTFPHFGTNWVPSPDTDGHIIIVNPDGTYLETQGLDLVHGTLHSVAQGNVITGDGSYAPQISPYTPVAPVPLAAGLILASEMNAGVIPHTIRCGVPWASSAFVFPAHNSDGGTAGGVPTGKRLWLPRNADLSSLTAAAQHVVATCMQEYGLVISDSGSSFSIPVESTADGSTYPFQNLSLPAQIVNQLVVLAGNGAMA